jgi:hypothetical protein
MAINRVGHSSRNGKPTLIYGLIDPLTNELRYVGKTSKSIRARLCGHKAHAAVAGRKRRVVAWIAGLIARGLLPEVVIFEEVSPAHDWIEAEQFWIAYFRAMQSGMLP